MPVLQQLTQRAGCPEALELSEPLDGENIRRFQMLFFPFELLVGFVKVLLIPDCKPGAFTEIEEIEGRAVTAAFVPRSEEHTSELQSLRHLVCRLLLEK